MSARHLFKNSILSLAAKLTNALIQVISLPVLLRVFGRENYGLIVIAMSLNTLIAILQLGLPTGIPKFISEWLAKGEHEQLKSAMRTVASFYIGIAMLNVLILLGIALFGVELFNVKPAQTETLQVLVIITAITSCLGIPAAALDQVLIGARELGFVSNLQLIKNVFFAALVAFVYCTPEFLSLTQFYAIRCIIMFLTIPLKVWRWTKYGSLEIFLPGWKFKAAWPLVTYCLSLIIFSIFIAVSNRLTPVILAIRATDNAGNLMSDYQIIQNIQLFMMMISGSFMAALVPHISGAVAGGDQGMFRKAITQGTKVVWSFGALVGFGIIMLSREVLSVYVGEEFLYLQTWLTLFIGATLYNLYSPAMASAILSSGKLVPLVFATGIGCLVSIMTCWYFAPHYGVGSVAFALIGYILVYFCVTHFWYFPRYFGINPLRQIFNIMLPPAFAGMLMCIAGRWIIHLIGCTNNWINIGIGAVCGTGIYTLIILTIYIRPKEVKLLMVRLRSV